MFELEGAVSELQRKMRTLLQYGLVAEIKNDTVKVDLGSGVTEFIPVVQSASDIFSPLKIGDQVALLCHQLVLGVVKKSSDLQGSDGETIFKREDGKIVINTDKIAIKKGGTELLSLIVQAVDTIAKSKTATFNGPQPLLTASTDQS